MADQDQGEDKDLLLKEAADMLDAAQQRDEAVKLAFAMVERGKIAPFESFSALNEKVASLMQRDLRVVQEALELDVELPDFGTVATEKTASASMSGFDSATASFHHMLADDST